VAAHAAVGCASSAASGGRCGSGAMGAGFGEFAGPILPDLGRIGNTVTSAVLGGTGSVLGGGKFANGAITGAYGYLFNDAVHYEESSKANDSWRYLKNSVLRLFGIEDKLVIGENMNDRVIPYAKTRKADWYEPKPSLTRDGALIENTQFIVQQMNQGVTIIDIGPQPGRANYPLPTSPFYTTEVIHVYGRNKVAPYEHLNIDRQK
jgi:hypothetical protein